jgi:CMP-N,N'-diacetyllegionaminic acid synthase
VHNGQRILGLITARGGSRRIARKNIKPLGGKPLIWWTIQAARQSTYLDRLVLSSEDDEIIGLSREFGCEAPFVRPAMLARDETPSIDVVLHALDELPEAYDYLLLLQPTSPFRTAVHIDSIIDQCLGSNAEAMTSVAKARKHPYLFFRLRGDQLEPLCQDDQGLARQEWPAAYEHNGALYLARVSFLRKTRSFSAPGARAFEMTGAANLDLDEEEDWEYAEYLLATGKAF